MQSARAGGSLPAQLDLGLDLDGEPKRQLGHPNRAASVGPALGAEHADDEVGETVDHGRLSMKAGRGIHHAEHARPAGYGLQAAELTFEARKDGETRKAR